MSRRSDNEATCNARIVDCEAVARARSALVSEPLCERATAIFAALSDPTRFRILEALLAHDLCVCDLAEVVGVSESATSHQLRLLRDRGLVTFRRVGQRAVYRLSDEHVSDIIAIGVEHARESRP